jgi:anti-anti-sigma regulatory factor
VEISAICLIVDFFPARSGRRRENRDLPQNFHYVVRFRRRRRRNFSAETRAAPAFGDRRGRKGPFGAESLWHQTFETVTKHSYRARKPRNRHQTVAPGRTEVSGEETDRLAEAVRRAVDRTGKAERPKWGYRAVRLARAQRGAEQSKAPPGESEAGPEESPTPAASVEVAGGGLPPDVDAAGAEEGPAEYARPPNAPAVSDCFRLYHLNADAAVVESLVASVDDGTAPLLGALCRELLASPRKRIFFDFSGAAELSTVALGVLVRFRNSAVYLDKRVRAIVSPRLREELEAAHVDRILDLEESLYPFLAPRVRLVEESGARAPEGGGKPGTTRPKPATVLGRIRVGLVRLGWALVQRAAALARALGRTGAALAGRLRRFLGGGRLPAVFLPTSLFLSILFPVLPATARAETEPPDAFPTLAELEAMLEEAPDLERLRVELEQLDLRRHWSARITLRANYSQHVSSFVPFVPTPELAVSGGTFVGVSVSASAAELLGRPSPNDLDAVRKRLELRALHARKLADLRQLYHQRRKHLLRLETLEAERETAALKWERVRLGLELMERMDPPPVAFDPIDRAEALQRLLQLDNERRRVETDVAVVEAEILGVLGRRDFGR